MRHSAALRVPLPLLLIMCIALPGCSGLLPKQAAAWAEQGQSYSATLREVNTLAQDESLAFTADVLPNLPRTPDILKTQTDEMRKRVRLAQIMDDSHAQLGLYFKALEQLALGQQVAQAEQAARELASSLKGLPKEVKTQFALPDVNSGFSAKVAQAIGKAQRHSALERVLKDHAELIGAVLELNEQVLAEQSRWITLRTRLAREVAYREQVEKPFLAEKSLGEAWKKAWIKDVKAQSTIALLEQAQVASIAMQDMWLQVLSGAQAPLSLAASTERLKARVHEFRTRVLQLDTEANRP